jgi:hypothetical protein
MVGGTQQLQTGNIDFTDSGKIDPDLACPLHRLQQYLVQCPGILHSCGSLQKESPFSSGYLD